MFILAACVGLSCERETDSASVSPGVVLVFVYMHTVMGGIMSVQFSTSVQCRTLVRVGTVNGILRISSWKPEMKLELPDAICFTPHAG